MQQLFERMTIMKNLDKMTPEAIIADVLSGQINVNELDLHRSLHREIFKEVLRKRPHLLKEVEKESREHFIKFALDQDPRYFVYLKEDQYTDEFAQMYIAKRFDELLYKTNNDLPVVIRKSLDDKIVISYSYATEEGGELYYPDPELMVPVSIKSSFKISVKIVNAVLLIDKLDIQITQLGARTIYSAITDLIVNNYKCYLNSYIKEKKVGYYTLCTSFEDIENGFIEKLDSKLKRYGISVSDFKLNGIAIPKDIQYKLEDQAFTLRQRKADVEADAEMAKISLESYEAKLSIQQKYPEADHSLTEYEKDLALKRYLIKNNRYETVSVDHDIDIDSKNVAEDSNIRKIEDNIPPIEPKKGGNGALIGTIVGGLILTVIGFAAGSVVMGIIFMIATIAASVIVGVSGSNKKVKTEPNAAVAAPASDSASAEASAEAPAETSDGADSADNSASEDSTEE